MVISRAAKAVRQTGTVIVDIVYPKRCAGCRERGAWVCAPCWADLDLFDGDLCEGCGVPTHLSRCRCELMTAGMTAIRSVGPFDGWLRQAVIDFKYQNEWARADHLGEALTAVVSGMPNIDALVPVPLHRSRLRERGYNQSALLAKAVGERLNLPVADAMVRTRRTAQQVHLSGAERMKNVDGAFAVSNRFHLTGLTIVLIDDVVTTGSTLNACARMLVQHGVATVQAATVARQL